jgi:hypothetical protein
MSENAQNTNTFKFFHNAETRLYIEGVKEKENSIFSDVYRAFFTELNDKLADIFDEKDVELRNNLNNIFAFVGDRGSGKTSCMLSVAKMMEENGENGQCKIPELKGDKIKFSVLESIDPSFFDDRTNILDIVLGRLFSTFKKEWDSGNRDCISKKNELLESFEKVKQSISNINVKKHENGNYICEEDNVDKLINLGASVNLKKDIQELIQRYLGFFEKKVLVVPIDDVDLHSKCAYEMVEQIRKYLVQYNVIILMALKIEQLDKVVEKTYVEEFENLIERGMLLQDQIADMSNKYLVKLIPDSQRFVLPTVEIMYNRIVEIYEKAEQSTENLPDFLGQRWEKDKINSGYPARYIVLKLIFDKTRYLFYHTLGATSLIVPHTLREYSHLLEMLVSMDDYDKIESISGKQYNKSVFKNYFIQSWCRSNLENKDCDFIRRLFSITDPSIINKTIVREMYTRFPKFFVKKMGEEFEKIFNENNNSYNVSVGDVSYLLHSVKGTLIKFNDKAFVFAIETFYSMRLYEYYDLRTEIGLHREKEKIEKEVIVSSVLDDFKEYEILVGGSFFNLRSEDGFGVVIPRNGDERKKRDRRLISLIAIRNVLKNLLSKDVLDEKDKKKFKLIELFALLTLRRKYDPDEEDGIRASDYRVKTDVVYASVFSPTQEKICFDVLSFFSNLSNVKRCYTRIDKDLFKKAKEMRESLYNCLLEYCKKNRAHAQNYEDHALLSYCAIRNMEIMNDFFETLKRNYDKIRFTADNRECLIKFFEGVCEYSIKSYKEKDEDDKKDWHQIDFKFVSEFIKVLDDDEIKDLFDDIFSNKIEMVLPPFEMHMKQEEQKKNMLGLDEINDDINNDNLEELPPSWEIFEDLLKCFDKSYKYSTADVRKIIRDELKNSRVYNHNISSWIARNLRNVTGVWNNPEIEAAIGKLVEYIKNSQAKKK